MENAGELHAVVVLVVGVAVFVHHVAEHGIGNPGLDAFHEILIRDVAVDPVLVVQGKGDDRHLPAFERHGSRRRIGRRRRRFQEAVRRKPDVELTQFGSRRLRSDVGSIHVPGVGAVHDRDGALVALNRRAAAAARRVVALPTGQILVRRPGVIVDRSGVGGDIKPRPIVGRAITLAHAGIPSRAGVLNRFDGVGAHGFRRIRDDGPGILCHRCRRQRRQEHDRGQTLVEHRTSQSGRKQARWCLIHQKSRANQAS